MFLSIPGRPLSYLSCFVAPKAQRSRCVPLRYNRNWNEHVVCVAKIVPGCLPVPEPWGRMWKFNSYWRLPKTDSLYLASCDINQTFLVCVICPCPSTSTLWCVRGYVYAVSTRHLPPFMWLNLNASYSFYLCIPFIYHTFNISHLWSLYNNVVKCSFCHSRSHVLFRQE